MFRHCEKCKALLIDGRDVVGRHLSDCVRIEDSREILAELERDAVSAELNGWPGKAAKLRRTASLISRLYSIVIDVSTEEPR